MYFPYLSDKLFIALWIIGILLFADIINDISISQPSCCKILIPSPEDLKNVSVEDIRSCQTGFRDKYIKSVVDYVNDNNEDVLSYRKLNTDECVKELVKFNGVGPKVADCIALFGMQKYDTFPVDVWVKRVMEEFYVEDNYTLYILVSESRLA